MNKVVLLSILLLSFSWNFTHAQDAKAKSIMDKAANKVKSMKAFSANFSLAVKDVSGKTKETIKGTFKMMGDRYAVDMNEQQILCDAKTVWTYLKKFNEVQISDFSPNEQTISPARLLGGAYDKEFKYSYSGEKNISGKKVHIISLIPKNSKQTFKSVSLYIDSNTDLITGGTITDKSGSSYEYNISNITANNSIKASDFIFDTNKHKGIEVINLR